VTEYHSPRKLKKNELKALADDTQGQWSDGIGEGGFLDYAEQTGISVDPYPIGRDKGTVTIEQIDDGVKTPPPKRTSPLFKAVESGDIDKIKKLLAKGEDINSRNKYNWTPLIYAIRRRQTEAALFLIEQGADVKLQARWGPRSEPEVESAIIWAAMQGDLLVLRRLIDAGADVDTRDEDGMTPGMFAANRGYIDLLQALIDAGGNMNLQNKLGWTALMSADPKRFDIMELLLKKGADPRIRNEGGRTAADEALFQAQGSSRASWQKKAEFLRQYER
jgi:ankyrin repeat protein